VDLADLLHLLDPVCGERWPFESAWHVTCFATDGLPWRTRSVMEQKPYVVGAIVGAAVGAAIGYLYFTDDGKRRRDELARLLDRAQVELREAQGLWQRVQKIGQQYQAGRRTAMDDTFDFDAPESVS
jgi:hypothetical protein